MSFPINPLTMTSAVQLAAQAKETVVEAIEQGVSFAELLLNEPAKDREATEPVDLTGAKLRELQQRLVERLQSMGVDLGFRIEIVAKGSELALDNVHPDHELIAEALRSDKQLHAMFEELQQALRQSNPSANSQGGLRLHLKSDEFTFDFGARPN